jgi:hypothetical protein
VTVAKIELAIVLLLKIILDLKINEKKQGTVGKNYERNYVIYVLLSLPL